MGLETCFLPLYLPGVVRKVTHCQLGAGQGLDPI